MVREKQALIAAMILMGVTPGLTVRADGALEARKAIQAAYDRFGVAMHRKDAESATADFTPDFTELDGDGAAIQSGIPTERRQFQALFLYSRSITVTETIQKLALRGKRAIVTIKEQMTLDSTKQTPQGVRPLTFCSDSVHEDVWVRSGRRWLRQSTRTLSIQETVDGKPDAPVPTRARSWRRRREAMLPSPGGR